MQISIDDVYSEWTNEVQEILHAPGYSTEQRVEELDKLAAILRSRQVRFKALMNVYSSMENTTKKIADEMNKALGYGVFL